MSIHLKNLAPRIDEAKVLLVGAGGIGCEVLKNLTLTGFKNIDVIDLDTIDVSNLNRQFLFNKSNVGQSKAKVAIEIAKRNYSITNGGLNLNPIHKSVMLSEFDVDFFKSYSFVINALDNRAARSHVNRMCLAAQVPLLESGTEGYLGQTSFIKNSLTACYECEGLQKDGRTYATCTIRNTPSQPIHCIVWAKHLFHQLFGEDDPDNDVSPQMEEKVSENFDNKEVFNGNGKADDNYTNNGNLIRNGTPENGVQTEENAPQIITTRELAVKNDYDTAILFEKLFKKDILYLLSMEHLWKERTKPSVLDYDNLINSDFSEEPQTSHYREDNSAKLSNQRLWTMKECAEIFTSSTKQLKKRLDKIGYLEWDKDDELALNFVTAASNLRCQNFNIQRKSPFDVKSLAGNIVPAISSTNSIIGGLLALQALRLLKKLPTRHEYRALEDGARNELLKGVGRHTYLKKTALNNSTLIASYNSEEGFPPQPNCLACSRGKIPEAKVYLSMAETTLSDLIDKIIIGTFHFVSPDICLNDGSGTILWSQEDADETDEATKKKKLLDVPRINPIKTRLLITDLLQDKELIIVLMNEKVDQEKHKEFFYVSLD